MHNIALVIGNGFSIGFNKAHNIEYDTLKPLSWDIRNPERQGQLMDFLPKLNKFIQAHPGLNNFTIFDLALKYHRQFNSFDSGVLISECRHYLTLAFSQYSNFIKTRINKKWPWSQWIYSNRDRITCISSFNYDLLIEKILYQYCISYFDAALPLSIGKVLLHKPHGSCNFDSHPMAVVTMEEGYKFPLKHCIDFNDTSFVRVPNSMLNEPRREPLCVIPNEHNIYSHYHRMLPHNTNFHRRLSKCNTLLIIGHSYSSSDRPEINEMLFNLPPNSKVIICNPTPCRLLNEKIIKMGLQLIEWKNPAGPIDTNGRMLMV